MPRVRRWALLGLATAVAIGAGACGGGSGRPGGQAGAAKVTIKGFAFSPDSLQAKVGDTVTVTNDDNAAHTLTAVDRSFDTGTFSSGSKAITLTKAGRFEFECLVHPFMQHGVIQVAG